MKLDKLKFVVDEIGNISEEEKQLLIESYARLFKEIYGYDIFNEYLKEKSNLKKSPLFQNAFIESIDILKSVSENENISLIIIYDENNKVVGFGRLKKIKKANSKNPIVEIVYKILEKHLDLQDEKSITIPDIAILEDYNNFKYEIWKKTISFIEMYVSELGYDRLYVEIPLNSPLLLKADDLGFIESPEDIPTIEKPRTRVLNKYLERCKNAELNSCRK